jgi:HEAT repeat protein
MPREQLKALQADIERLLIAGAPSAAGDEGLQRRAETLRELAKKVPALTLIAEAANRVHRASPMEAAPALLDLLLLVKQAQASLAAGGAAGTLEPLPPSGPWRTATPARDLYPLLETLGTSGSGKTKALKDACDRGIVADLRLFEPLLAALEDGYAEFAHQAAEQALPLFGKAPLDELRAGLNMNGKAADARRLRCICRIDAPVGGELCRAALREGNAVLRAEALELLASIAPEEAERRALQLLRGESDFQAKGREVKASALRALAGSASDDALEALLAAVQDHAQVWEAARKALETARHPRTTERLIGELRTISSQLGPAHGSAPARADKSQAAPSDGEDNEVVERTCRLAHALGSRRDRQAVPALLPLLAHPHANIREAAVQALTVLRDPAGLEAAAKLADDPAVWQVAILAAWQLPPAACYDRLAPVCAGLSDRKQEARERAKWVLSRLTDYQRHHRPGESVDPRWSKLLLKHLRGPCRSEVALALTAVAREQAIPSLLKELSNSLKEHESGVVHALGELRAREAVPTMLKWLPSLTSKHRELYAVLTALQQIGDPSSVAPLEKLHTATQDRYLKAIVGHTLEQVRERQRA